MHEAYSHEVSSCGYWPGGSEEGSFYAYAYPEPPGFADHPAGTPGGRYDAELGARPLRRTIQREIEDALSERLLWNEFSAGQLIVVDVEDDAIAFRAVDAPETPAVELASSGEGS